MLGLTDFQESNGSRERIELASRSHNTYPPTLLGNYAKKAFETRASRRLLRIKQCRISTRGSSAVAYPCTNNKARINLNRIGQKSYRTRGFRITRRSGARFYVTTPAKIAERWTAKVLYLFGAGLALDSYENRPGLPVSGELPGSSLLQTKQSAICTAPTAASTTPRYPRNRSPRRSNNMNMKIAINER